MERGGSPHEGYDASDHLQAGEAMLTCAGDTAELSERERGVFFADARAHFEAATRLAPRAGSLRAAAQRGASRAADGADRAALMEQARGLLQAAAADETADERRQALFTQARNLFGRVQAACPYNFDARQGAERASSGEQLEELINEGCKLLRMPSPPPVVATAAPALARAASGGGGGPDQAAGVQERRERMRKAASCFLTAQQLDPRCARISTAL